MKFIFLSLGLAAGAYAQVAAGNLSGTVRDESAAVVVGAAITAAQPANNFSRAATTDARGNYVFDQLPPGEENHLTIRGPLHATHLHSARLWCDIIEPNGCTVIGTYAKDFYSGRPALTMNDFGEGKAIYIGTISHQPFYHDLVAWLRQMCNIHPLLKVPDTVEVSMREKDGARIYFLLNHQNSPIRISFFKPMHDFLTGKTFTGNYDLPPHGVLVLDEGGLKREPEA